MFSKRPNFSTFFSLMILLGAMVVAQQEALSVSKLSPETKTAFQAYVSNQESIMKGRLAEKQPFLTVAEKSENRKKLKNGELIIEKIEIGDAEAPDGMIHDWVGAIFVPDISSEELANILLDYDRHQEIYPEAMDSRLIEKESNRLRGFLRLKKKKVLTVVLNTEHEVTFGPSGSNSTRWHIWSHSTKINEVDNPGEPGEKVLPSGEGNGFLWNLNAYWWLEEADGGVYAECRSISLSRSIPWALRWVVKPFVTSVPKESLVNTLTATRMEAIKQES